MPLQVTDSVRAVIEPMLRAARVPGGAVAIVEKDRTLLAEGYGWRDLETGLPLTAATTYPIASTSKAINTTLIGMLVDEGRLAWDAPVQDYLPRFELGAPSISSEVTLRDLLLMRTGLPRHDWLWLANPMRRADIPGRLRHLDLSSAFRTQFQYNNLTSTVGGHIAEVVTGESWEKLVSDRILKPLRMGRTGFGPVPGETTLSYHEDSTRKLLASERMESENTAPSGGSIHSSVEDMGRWIAFNLCGGAIDGRTLIKSQTLAEIHSPQIFTSMDEGAPSPQAAYALGWFADTYLGNFRLTHGGYLHDVNSEVTLFPQLGLGIVSFINFGFPVIARLINEHVFAAIMGLKPVQSIDEKLAQYETKIRARRECYSLLKRATATSPSHPISHYAGSYEHRGYGVLEIHCMGEELLFRRGTLELPLEHWHYDAWIARDVGRFYLHIPHSFDRASRFLFDSDADGEICAVSIRLEPKVAPIRFQKV